MSSPVLVMARELAKGEEIVSHNNKLRSGIGLVLTYCTALC